MRRQQRLDGRWSDSEDFTSEHDSIMLWLQKSHCEIVEHLERGTFCDVTFTGEPELYGLFPDAIADGTLDQSHGTWNSPVVRDVIDHAYYSQRPADRDPAMWEFPYEVRRTCKQCGALDWTRKRTKDEADAVHWPEDETCERRALVVFEIKPIIRSFGEVLRQMRLYATRLAQVPHNMYEEGPCLRRVILISPDPRFDEAFSNEGFPVIRPGGSG